MLRAWLLVAAALLGGSSIAALLGFDPWDRIGPGVPSNQAQQQMRDATESGHASSAIALYATALLRDPSSPNRWTRLGNAYLAAGDANHATDCFSRALTLGPQIPEVQMRVAQFDFAHARFSQAIAAAKRLLSLDPSVEETVFTMYDRQRVPVARIFEEGIPGQPTAYSYFEHLRKTSAPSEVDAGWQWMVRRQWVNPVLARGYIETSLQTGNFAAAAGAASLYLAAIDPHFRNPSLVFDGGFEVPPDNAPLAWTLFPFEGISVERFSQPSSSAHSGRVSLHLHFANAGNALFGHVLQRLYPRPGRWRARAFIRTADLSSSEGVRLLISDSDSPARLYVQTPAIVGTHDWSEVETTFVVTAATHELKLQIFRPKDNSQDPNITGDAWIDDISVEPVQPE